MDEAGSLPEVQEGSVRPATPDSRNAMGTVEVSVSERSGVGLLEMWAILITATVSRRLEGLMKAYLRQAAPALRYA